MRFVGLWINSCRLLIIIYFFRRCFNHIIGSSFWFFRIQVSLSFTFCIGYFSFHYFSIFTHTSYFSITPDRRAVVILTDRRALIRYRFVCRVARRTQSTKIDAFARRRRLLVLRERFKDFWTRGPFRRRSGPRHDRVVKNDTYDTRARGRRPFEYETTPRRVHGVWLSRPKAKQNVRGRRFRGTHVLGRQNRRLLRSFRPSGDDTGRTRARKHRARRVIRHANRVAKTML